MSIKNLNSRLPAYRAAFATGELQKTYQALVGLVQSLRTGFFKKYKGQYSVASVLHGYIDFTYFYLQNVALKKRKLKFAIVFQHRHASFELWLLGQTKAVQTHYWRKLRDLKWVNKELMPAYSIFEIPLLLDPDLDSATELSESICSQFEALSEEILSTLAADE